MPAPRQHKELRTRIGHQILRLQHLLPPSRGVEQLIALHIDCYEKLWGLDAAVTDMNSREPRPMVLESFTNLMSEIDGRMSTVVETLMEGLRESQRAQQEAGSTVIDLPTPIITEQVDRFLQVRALPYATPTKLTYARRTTMCFGCSLNGPTPLRFQQPGAHRYLDPRPALPRHQQGPRGGALHPAHRAHPDGPGCQPHARLLCLHLVLLLQVRGISDQPLPVCVCGLLRVA